MILPRAARRGLGVQTRPRWRFYICARVAPQLPRAVSTGRDKDARSRYVSVSPCAHRNGDWVSNMSARNGS